MQVRFTNPVDATYYDWPVNPPPDGIQPSGKTLQIERTSNTGNVGATKQQGDDGPYIINWNINVFHGAHEAAMWVWYELSKQHTIYLRDWSGNEYEGQIIALEDGWVGVVAGPGDATARLGYNKMNFQFEIWAFRSGPQHDAGVNP